MRFLVDECTGPRVAAWLREQGHEVYSVYDEAGGAADTALLAKAAAEAWIVVTVDKDFGEMVYRERLPHAGIVLLRLDDQRAAAKIEALRGLLGTYAEHLPGAFVVATPSQVRFGPAP